MTTVPLGFLESSLIPSLNIGQAEGAWQSQPGSQFHTRMRLQRSLSSLTYRQMVRRLRFERKIEFWERHMCQKVNRVLPWTQRRQYNPETIGYCVAGQRASSICRT